MLNNNEKEKLNINSTKYVEVDCEFLQLFSDQFKTCRIVHKKSGLFFNGFSNPAYNRGKNTLSVTNFSSVVIGNKTDEDIILNAFSGHIIERNGIKLVHNKIIYSGSEINKILSNLYEDLDYLPVEDFIVERDFKKLQ